MQTVQELWHRWITKHNLLVAPVVLFINLPLALIHALAEWSKDRLPRFKPRED